MDLDADDRRVLLILDDAGEGGLSVEGLSQALRAEGRDVDGTWFLGPFTPPWFSLRELVSNLEYLGLLWVTTPIVAASYGETTSRHAPVPQVGVTDLGHDVADRLRAAPSHP